MIHTDGIAGDCKGAERLLKPFGQDLPGPAHTSGCSCTRCVSIEIGAHCQADLQGSG